MRRVLLGFFLTVIVVGLAGVAVLVDAHRQLQAPLAIAAPSRVELPPGSRMRDAVAALEQRGFFANARQPLYLEVLARATGEASRIKAGEYALEPGLTARGVLGLWVSGKTVLHELRIIEGIRFDTAMKLLAAHAEVAHTLKDLSGAAVMTAIGRAGDPWEGRFFPDTYRFTKGTTDLDILKRAYAAMETELAKAWEGRAPDLPYATPAEALTMASIVEKETGVPEERTRVAGVFVRRLKTGMRLQTDPTLIYGLGDAFDGNLRKRDLIADGPYNSYLRAGLPPTPICLPGRASIEAALHPAEGTELYFVARGDGTHQFSTTIEEHEAAVRKYQLKGG